MLDATYQSVVCYFMVHLVFAPGVFVTSGGQDVGDRNRVGVYVATGSVIVVNMYIMLNTYRWDWLMCLLTGISTLLIFFWTGVWSTNDGFAEFFYQAAAQVFSQPSFWAVTALIVIMCLLPRFVIKFLQKVYFPYDVDIIREQVRQGKFDYLDDPNASPPPKEWGGASANASNEDFAKPSKHSILSFDSDQRPLKAPSVAATTNHSTHNSRSQNGSDASRYTGHRFSMQLNGQDADPSPLSPNNGRASVDRARASVDRARPSFDRMRQSMDRIRPSFEQTNDFTSAAMLTRMESSHSFGATHSRRSMQQGQMEPFTDMTPHAR